ncbi:MAG TPA: fumarylacetoacetase [Bryobacteraceae bacterium]|nr:fumarylacetoacetase [Bryobacteraceae bacterium]
MEPFSLLDATHDPNLTSWVESANLPGTDFPIQNLPFGVFASRPTFSVGVAIGDRILDMRRCAPAGLLDGLSPATILACQEPRLNVLMSLGRNHWSPLRRRLSELLRAGGEHRAKVEPFLISMADAELALPAKIGDYTDFYASIHHATNVGRLFRPDNPLLPNYKYVPIGYHGRASSIVPSGMSIHRPSGQTKDAAAEAPFFGPTRALDYELEAGFFTGPGNELGRPIPISEAESYIFGLCLLNDWSARDVQSWEYQPLGPFLAKSFATTISPWVVTLEALAPFRVPAFPRPEGDPAPLAYLNSVDDQARGGIDLTVEAYIASRQMRDAGLPPMRLSRGNLRNLYWTPAQLLTHHASNGCNLRPGDLLASGTVSGPLPEERGCLLELTRRGADPIRLPTGELRKFLEDGDEVILRAYCARGGCTRIGFGECRGTVGI